MLFLLQACTMPLGTLRVVVEAGTCCCSPDSYMIAVSSDACSSVLQIAMQLIQSEHCIHEQRLSARLLPAVLPCPRLLEAHSWTGPLKRTCLERRTSEYSGVVLSKADCSSILQSGSFSLHIVVEPCCSPDSYTQAVHQDMLPITVTSLERASGQWLKAFTAGYYKSCTCSWSGY